MTISSDHPRKTDGNLWQAESDGVQVVFAGVGWPDDLARSLARLMPPGVESASLKQIHSARVQIARPGFCGEGDALITDRAGLALCVVTADCVPVLLASRHQVAAVHAGWRGLAQEILPAAVARFEAPENTIRAWIGPAIGRCCYEVSDDVAMQVQNVSPGRVLAPGRGERPHLDLHAAAISQLEAAGVQIEERLDPCTRCCADHWHSYRRSGPGAGRNLACIWRN